MSEIPEVLVRFTGKPITPQYIAELRARLIEAKRLGRVEVLDDHTNESDANTLRAAAAILERRTTKPGNFWLGVICRILRNTASKAERTEP